MHKIQRRLRHRRDVREFNRAFDTASPSMQHELIVAAMRQGAQGR